MNLHNSHVPARCETVYEALEKWVNKPLNKLPHDLKTVATAYIPKWTTLTAKERIAKAIEVDRQRDTKLRIKLARAARQKQQDKYDPAMLLQGDVGWYDATLEADHWAALSDIGPQDAALLLCQFNPNEQDYETARRITTDELGPEHLTRLVQRLTDIDKSDHRPRTLRDWYLTARDAGLRFHSWASRYMEATAAPVVSDTPATPAPVLTDQTEAAEPASDKPAPLTTSQIASCFAGFHEWDFDHWRDNLQTPAPWLKRCQHRAGNQGKPVTESTWWPLEIAKALDKKHPNIRQKLHARFKHQEPLKPWLESIESDLPYDD